MALLSLDITSFRNLKSVSIKPARGFNIIFGENASGKTSLIEAIYCLGLGKSFRTTQLNSVIHKDEHRFSVSGTIENNKIITSAGIEKLATAQSKTKINQKEGVNISELSSLFPIQLITPHTFNLFQLGPQSRRAFIDWGVFHVEQEFIKHWRRFNIAIKNRNAALKERVISKEEIETWNHELNSSAENMNTKRLAYLEQFTKVMIEMSHHLFPIDSDSIEIKFNPGWDKTEGYLKVLESNFKKDRLLGFTQYGPHKADFKIFINQEPASEWLSHGQQKLLICAMKVAQAALLRTITNKNCLFLLDDLTSELDENNQEKLLKFLLEIEAQTFATAVTDNLNQKINGINKFYIKNGVINKC